MACWARDATRWTRDTGASLWLMARTGSFADGSDGLVVSEDGVGEPSLLGRGRRDGEPGGVTDAIPVLVDRLHAGFGQDVPRCLGKEDLRDTPGVGREEL